MAASDKSEFLLTALKVFKNSSGDADPKAINVTAAIWRYKIKTELRKLTADFWTKIENTLN